MTRITLLEGAGRYADPWHPFSSTSSAIADELAALGAVVRRTDIEDALSELHEPDRRPDLLVLNVGNAGEGTPPFPTGTRGHACSAVAGSAAAPSTHPSPLAPSSSPRRGEGSLAG